MLNIQNLVNEIIEEYCEGSVALSNEINVIKKYGEMFKPENIEKLTEDDFREFLKFKNNKHWKNLSWRVNYIVRDMKKLRETITLLLNEEIDISERLDETISKKGAAHIPYLGRAILTPILFLVYPEKYSVYNNITEEGMLILDLYPIFTKGMTFSERYLMINDVILNFSKEYNLSLWQIDHLWWNVIPSTKEEEINHKEEYDEEYISSIQRFHLESYLEDFLVENWDRIEELNNLEIYELNNGDLGKQYKTDIGVIDLLCVSKSNTEFVVIELKKGKSSDKVIGQIKRYMGWVKEKLVTDNQKVRGIIIALRSDEKLRYALKTISDIDLMIYNIEFSLNLQK